MGWKGEMGQVRTRGGGNVEQISERYWRARDRIAVCTFAGEFKKVKRQKRKAVSGRVRSLEVV